MQDKSYQIIVEKLNRLQIFAICMITILGAYGLSTIIEQKTGVIIKGEIILLMIIVVACVVLTKFERFFPSTEQLEVTFCKDVVLFQRSRKKRAIEYTDIREVEKMMIINRYHSEKGYYRVKVKTKGNAYVMYSGERSDLQLEFEETGISKVYFEFQKRGVKCC